MTSHSVFPILHFLGMISGVTYLVSFPVSLPQTQMQYVLIPG